MKKSYLSAAILLALSASAWAQSVKDFVEVEGARANKLRGYGIVTGLNGAGDSPRGESARVLRAMLQNMLPPDVAVQEINARNAALVMVAAEIAPFQKKGTRLDVSVSVVGDTKSLYGGELQITDLRGPLGRSGQDPAIFALASGRVVVQGDVRRGNNTTGTVPAGAIVERELTHAFVQDKRWLLDGRELSGKAFRLVLKKPDITTASQLALQINATALTGPQGRHDVAVTIDGGMLEVRIPSVAEYKDVTGAAPSVDYEHEPIRWLEKILNQPVTFYAVETATVILNDATKSIAWTGEVRLRRGSVMLPPATQGQGPSVFHVVDDGERLSDFMKKNEKAFTEQQMVDVVKALHGAGLIKAEVRSN